MMQERRIRAHTIREMIHEAVLALGGSRHEVSRRQIIRYIRERYPHVPEGSILPADYCRNTRTGRHVPPRYRFLWQTRRSWYRMAPDNAREALEARDGPAGAPDTRPPSRHRRTRSLQAQKGRTSDLVAHPERAREVARSLLKAYESGGWFGETVMPEDPPPPGVAPGSEPHLRFLTLTVALDYLRDAAQLWRAAREALASPEKAYLFVPSAVVQTPDHQVHRDLKEAGIARRPDRDGRTWLSICRTLVSSFEGSVTTLLSAAGWDAPNLLAILRDPQVTPGFPYLRGRKIGPLWIRILDDSARVPLRRMEKVPIPVDIHIARATLMTGVLSGNFRGRFAELAKHVESVWADALRDDPQLYPLRIDQALCHWSRLGCSQTPGFPCIHADRCPVAEYCTQHEAPLR